MKSKAKKIIIFLIIFALLIVGYAVFFQKEPAPPLAVTSGEPASVSSSSVGQEFLTLLLSVRNIRLDDAIFSSPAFGRLQDYTIVLVPEGNEGRKNPFAPIGVDSFLVFEAIGSPEEAPLSAN